MTYHARRELQQSLKHAFYYICRLLMQGVSNFWQICKGQQIIQLVVCLLITLVVNIRIGIIEFDKASINTQAAIYFCLTLFILVVLVSLITAPFHLDREREEMINVLTVDIGKLNNKLTTQIKSATESVKDIQSTKVSLSPPKKDLTKPIIAIEEARIVKFDSTSNKEVIYDSESWDSMAFVADFSYHPTKNSYKHISIKARIEFLNPDNTRLRLVKIGFWQGDIDEEIHLTMGDTKTLTIALLRNSVLHSCEYGAYIHYVGEKFSDPIIQPIDGEKFIIKTELIVKHNDTLIMNPKHSFGLLLNPEIRFEEIKEGQNFRFKSAENPEKRKYKIEQLREYISESREMDSWGAMQYSIENIGRIKRRNETYHQDVERFLTQYFDESRLQRFQEKGVIALEEFLKELLD